MAADTDTSRRALIVGAGPVGLCAARALSLRGVEVDVIERQPESALAEPAFDGREVALTHGSMRILGELGVWQRISVDEQHPLRRASVADGDPPGFEVDADSFGEERLGTLVSNCVIRAAAWRAVAADDRIRLHAGVALEVIERAESGFAVRVANGERLSASLLVAADGRFSNVRRLLGVPVRMHDFGKTMIVTRMRHEREHSGIAREWFGRDQTRALLPLEEHVASVALTVTGAEAARLMARDDAAFAGEVEKRFEHRLGAMESASTRHAYPLVATWARRFAGPGWALVGDAAVGMHPVTAHGFNLGLASVGRLANAVSESLARGRGTFDPEALARFQRRHRRAAWPLYVGTGVVAGLYTDDRPLAQPVRRGIIAGMRMARPLRDALAAVLVDAGPLDPSLRQRLRRGVQRLLRRTAPAA